MKKRAGPEYDATPGPVVAVLCGVFFLALVVLAWLAGH